MGTQDVLQKIAAALKIIRGQFPSTNLAMTMESIKSQLDFMKRDLERSQPDDLIASKEDVQRIIIGVQAVREIESQNEELADLLCDIDYEYKKIHGIVL